MGFGPKISHRGLRESPRYDVQLGGAADGNVAASPEELTIDDKLGTSTDGEMSVRNLFGGQTVAPNEAAEMAAWKLFGEKVAALNETKEIERWRSWVDETFPIVRITGSYTITEPLELEEKLTMDLRDRRVRSHALDKRDENRGRAEDAFSTDFYNRLGRVLSPHIIEDGHRFSSALENVRLYMDWARREWPAVMKSPGFGAYTAKRILPFYVRYGNGNAPEEVQRRFSMFLSDVTHSVPQVVHALNMLAVASFDRNSYVAPGVNGSGPREHEPAGSQKLPYVNRAHANRPTPLGLGTGHSWHKPQPVYVGGPSQPRAGIDGLLHSVNSSPLPGIM